MFSLALVILAISCGLSLLVPRYALWCLLLIGFSQDIFRKLIYGEPVIFVIFSGIVFMVAFTGLIMRIGIVNSLKPFTEWTQKINLPLFFFLAIVVIQLLNSLVSYGNLRMSLIGFMSYTAPLMSIIVGYYMVNSIEDIRRFMKVYFSAGLLVAITVLLSFNGLDLAIFKGVGVGITIYDQGTALKSYSGIMRTGEVAAWHIATAGCFFFILLVTSEKQRSFIWAALILVVLVVSVSVTGRRKMLMLVSMFGLLYFFSNAYLRKSLNLRYFISASIASFSVWVLIELAFPGGYSSDLENYLARGASVYSDATSRFYQLGLAPIVWAYNRTGLFGGGLGIASQGAGQFSNVSVAGGAGEGGLGKIMVELGLPGLIISVWLFFAIMLYINRGLHLSARREVNARLMPLMLGISVLLFVNALTFSVASQVYGDIFVMLLLGLMVGFLFALPKLIIQSFDQSHA